MLVERRVSPLFSNTGEKRRTMQGWKMTQGNPLSLSRWRLPKNVYLLLFFTLGKGCQLSIANLTLNYYVHSLGYQQDFIGLFSAFPAIGSLLSAIPTGILADRWGRKPVLLMTALLSPGFLALTALMTAAPFLLICSFIQGLVSAAYWVTNLPLLIESTSEKQRVAVLALNSFLLLGVGSLGNLLGGAVPELVGMLMHTPSNGTVPLRWGVFVAASFTFVFGIPLWLLRESRVRQKNAQDRKDEQNVPRDAVVAGSNEAISEREVVPTKVQKRSTVLLFGQLLLPDLVFTMGEGAVVALIQVYFVLRFHLLPGVLGVIFTLSGFLGGIFALLAPFFVKRWSKIRIITIVQYVSAPLMILTGLAPLLPLAIVGEYTRSFLRTLIEPVYAAFTMEQAPPRLRATLSGFYSVTWSVGFSVGPTIAGWLQKNVSLGTSFLFGACCLVLAPTLLLIFFGKKARV